MSAAGVYEAHGEFLWASLHRCGVREADLPDMLQEVLVVVHRRRDSFDGSSKLTSWLFGIVLRVAAGYRRRAHVRREELTDEPHGEADEAPSPEDDAVRRDASRRLRAVLDGMDVDKRALFVMFELEEMSCSEIAAQLDVPVGTVHSRLHAARKDFEKSLARQRARERRGGDR